MAPTPTKRAFTLVEVLLSVGLIVALSGISIPVFQSFQYSNELDSAVNLAARAYTTAQVNARGMQADTNWGVRVAGGNITVFSGDSYATRNANLDLPYVVAGDIGVSGTTEIVFSKLTGLPQTTGTVNFSQSGNTRSITINAKGRINF